MNWLRNASPALLSGLLFCGTPWAEDPGIALTGPEVVKLDRNTRGLTAADMDANGRTDLLLINNDKARIEILYQLAPGEALPESRTITRPDRWTPVLDDSRFRRQGVTTGDQMLALAAADFDGDGRADLAYSARDRGLVVLYQTAAGDWDDRWVFDQETPSQFSASLLATDLNGDGRTDLSLLGEQTLLVFHQQPSGGFQSPQRYPLAEDNSYAPLSQDLNGDGRPDLLYIARNSDYALRARLQGDDGRFGAERVLRMRTPRGTLTRWTDAEGRTEFAAIDPRTGLIEGFSVSEGASGGSGERLLPTPRIQAVPGGGAERAGDYALADLDGDGLQDIVVADSGGARLWFYRQAAPARFEPPVSFPAFADIRSVAAADVDGDGRAELFLASPEEKVFGIARYSPEGRIGYPEPLPAPGEPIAIAALPGPNGNWRLACLAEHQKKRRLALYEFQTATGDWQELQVLDLEDLRTDPEGVRVADFDRDGIQDLILFVPRSPAVLLRQDADGELARLETQGGFQSGLLDDLRPGDLSVADLDGDGSAELLLADKGLVRAVHLDPRGEVQVIDQFNLDNREAEVASALAADLDGDGIKELLLLPQDSEAIQIQRRDAQGVYRPWRSDLMGRITVLDTRIAGGANGAPAVLLYFGEERFWVVAPGDPQLLRQGIESHETAIKDLEYGEIAFGDLNGDGSAELITLDNRSTRILEVLQRRDGHWTNSLHFAVFDDPSDDAGSAEEPREMLVRDLTGDGKDDITLLVHDRVLVYPAL